MVIKEDIMAAVRARCNRVLLIAESALPPTQYRAYRTLLLNEFGKSGLEGDVERLLGSASEQERQGQGRNT